MNIETNLHRRVAAAQSPRRPFMELGNVRSSPSGGLHFDVSVNGREHHVYLPKTQMKSLAGGPMNQSLRNKLRFAP